MNTRRSYRAVCPCIRGIRDGTIGFPNATVPGQVVIPEGADLGLIAGRQKTDKDEGLGLGNRTVLVVRSGITTRWRSGSRL